MATATPYTYFQCPCTSDNSSSQQKAGEAASLEEQDETEDERNFDPRAPRSNYSLYPLEHLLYCEDCQQIRCPRCVLDEIVTWYCPNCLFEVPSSTVKSEGNRCTRSCFQCPICTSPLSVNSLDNLPAASLLGSEQAAQTGPFVLSCAYCNWSSQEIGIKFERSNGIYSQLSRIKNGGEPTIPLKERRRDEGGRKPSPSIAIEGDGNDGKAHDDGLNPEIWFSNLKSFYQSQLAEISTSGSLSFAGDYGYGSPGALSRIMGLYTGGSFADKKTKTKAGLMREAYGLSEGLHLCPPTDTNIQQLRKEGWAGTTSLEQRSNQPNSPHFVSDLRPVPCLLRTKRSKRCRTCRHILSKPEAKVLTTRFRIRLVALNYIPSMTIVPLTPNTQPSSSGTSTPSGIAATTPALLQPLKSTQFLLTLKNPLFDPVKITLATPSHTPGRFSSKITILCPQFEIGANTDVWDEALQEGTGVEKDRRRTAKDAGDGQVQAEAGKVWERGRNWVSIVVEVVPALLSSERSFGADALAGGTAEGRVGDAEQIGEDDDLLEIPVFVRVDWETDVQQDDATGAAKDKDVKEKRELAYWCVLGVGRIAQL